MKYFLKTCLAVGMILCLTETWGAMTGITQNQGTINSISDTTRGSGINQDQGEKITLQPFLWKAFLLSSLVIGVFFMGGLLMYLSLKRKVLSILHDEKHTYNSRIKNSEIFNSFKLIALIEMLKIRKDQYKEELNQLKEELDEELKNTVKLTNEVGILTLRNEELERQVRELIRLTNDDPGTDREHQPIPKSVRSANENKGQVSTYFTIPENDGSFSIEKGEYFANSKKFYKIEAGENSDYGKLYFLSGDLDVKAINNIDFYLIPVCEVENLAMSNSATRIIQQQHGTVVKIADKWVVDKKIKVKLI